MVSNREKFIGSQPSPAFDLVAPPGYFSLQFYLFHRVSRGCFLDEVNFEEARSIFVSFSRFSTLNFVPRVVRNNELS